MKNIFFTTMRNKKNLPPFETRPPLCSSTCEDIVGTLVRHHTDNDAIHSIHIERYLLCHTFAKTGIFRRFLAIYWRLLLLSVINRDISSTVVLV
jgi:hypothetical protein